MADITPAHVFPVGPTYNAPGSTYPTPTTPYSGTFIPTLWSGKLARKFYLTTIFGEIANHDWEGEIKNVGDKVIINTIPDITINDYVVGGNLTYEVPEGEVITLTVDKGKYFSFTINDVMEHQSKPNLLNVFSDDAAHKMAAAIDRDVIYTTFFKRGGDWKTSESGKDAMWVYNCGSQAGIESHRYDLGTDADPVVLTGDNIISKITALSTVLDEANVPRDGRYLVITPAERHTLMQSPLAQAYFTGDAQSIVRNGRIGRIDGFDIYLSNNLPRAAEGQNWNGDGGTGPARHLIFAGHKCAISFASQITKTETLRNPQDFGDLIRGLNIYGNAVTQGQALTAMVVGNTTA